MDTPIPKRLKQEPLIEALWQVQFEPEPSHPLGDVLPGVLFTELRRERPDLQLVRLPVAEIPAQIAAQDPNLRYAAKYRIEASGWSYLFHVGDRVATVNCRRPYVGWSSFRGKIIQLINILESSGLIPAPRQHSLRYIDLLTLESPPTLGGLRTSIQIGEYAIERFPVQLRVELPDRDCRHVLQIATPADVHLPSGEAGSGTLIDLETVSVPGQSDWAGTRAGLDGLHDASKAMFFRQLLTPKATAQMEPEYTEADHG